MKIHFVIFVLIAGIMVSCGGRTSSEKVAAKDAASVSNLEAMELVVNTSESVIHWKGFKPGGGHHGTLSLLSGVLKVKDNAVVGGRFIINMNSIVNEDLNDAESAGKLVAHLKSADFFDTETYPMATFEITSITPKEDIAVEITGNLTMKDITKSITFPANITSSAGIFSASTPAFAIDRTQWGVNYGSKNVFKNLKDSFINDEMEIQIEIKSQL